MVQYYDVSQIYSCTCTYGCRSIQLYRVPGQLYYNIVLNLVINLVQHAVQPPYQCTYTKFSAAVLEYRTGFQARPYRTRVPQMQHCARGIYQQYYYYTPDCASPTRPSRRLSGLKWLRILNLLLTRPVKNRVLIVVCCTKFSK